MQIALIGFSKSGKTTVFNALTGANAEVSAFAAGKDKTHRAVVEVPDDRLKKLSDLFESKKYCPATIDYLDPIGIRRDQAGTGESLGLDMLNTIANADALVAVIRAFQDDSGVDCAPVADFEAVHLELVLSDLAKVENRLERLKSQMQRIAGKDRAKMEVEAVVMERLKGALESSQPIRSLEFDVEEDRILKSFQFLTSKQLIIVVNTGEGVDGEELISKMKATLSGDEKAYPVFLTLCGNTEMEIAQLAPEERVMFLEEYGITEPGAARMIRLSYAALGLISFFTIGPQEAHAWTIRKGISAVEAAGTIHSDLQRGFIRAQITPWDLLLKDKTFAEAKKQAHLRVEGKEYVMTDGDVVEVMFSV
jgi:ribosome-binding ATPase